MDTQEEKNSGGAFSLTSPVFNEKELAEHLGLKELKEVTKVTVHEGNELYEALVGILAKSVHKSLVFEPINNNSGDSDDDEDDEDQCNGTMDQTEDFPKYESKASYIKCTLGSGTHKFLFGSEEIFVTSQTLGYPVGTSCSAKLYKTLLICMKEANKVNTISQFCNVILKRSRKVSKGSIKIFRYSSDYQRFMKEEVVVARSVESVILPKADKDYIMEDISEFTSDEVASFYKKHGIPYKRSYLFHGVPGAGKTSLIQALAGKYKRDIYVINPTGPRMTDATLKSAFVQASSKHSLIIVEDIDALFSIDRRSLIHGSNLTFSGLLNALDGVGGGNGLLLILTTNHRERLDPALIRSGRVDIEIKFNHATHEQMEAIFRSFCGINEENWTYASEFATNLSALLNTHKKNVSMAQLQHFFILNRKSNSIKTAANYTSILQLIEAKEEVEAECKNHSPEKRQKSGVLVRTKNNDMNSKYNII